VDLEKPVATVESAIDPEDRLQLVAEQIEGEFLDDVKSRKEEIVRALGKVV